MKYTTLIVALIGFTGCNAPTITPTSDQSNSNSGLPLSTSSQNSSNSSNSNSSPPTSFTHFIYVANKGDDTISEYGVNMNDGSLWPLAGNETIPTHSQPVALIMTPNHQFLYAIG